MQAEEKKKRQAFDVRFSPEVLQAAVLAALLAVRVAAKQPPIVQAAVQFRVVSGRDHLCVSDSVLLPAADRRV